MGGKYNQDTTKNRITYQNCGCCHTIMKQNANWVKKIKSMAKLFWMIFCDFFENDFLPVLGKLRFSFNFDFLKYNTNTKKQNTNTKNIILVTRPTKRGFITILGKISHAFSVKYNKIVVKHIANIAFMVAQYTD